MEHSAALPPLAAQPALWLLVALPLLAALGVRWRPALARPAAAGVPLAVALGTAWLAAPALLRPGTSVLASLGPALQLGPLDVGWTLAVDLPAAAAVIAFSALVGAWRWARSQAAHDDEAAPLLLALGGLTLTAWADPVPLVLAGAALAGLGAARLGAPVAPLAALGDALVLGAALAASFTTLGGFTPERQLAPALAPRLQLVTSAAEPLPGEADARLTLLAPAGARVELGGAPLCAVGPEGQRGGVAVAGTRCARLAEAPFVALPAPAALQELRVTPGDGVGALVADRVRLEGGRTTLALVASATLSVRELSLWAALRDENGRRPFRVEWPGRRLGGVPVLEVAAALAALGLLLRLAALWPRAAGVVPLGGAPLAFAIALPPLVASRLAPLFSMGTQAQALLALGGAALAAAAGAAALRHAEPHLRLGLLGLSAAAVLVVGVAAGVPGAAVTGAAVLALGVGAAALETPLGALALVAPLVGLGAAREAIHAATLGLGGPGAGAAALVLIALGAAALAVGRTLRGVTLDGAPPPARLALGAALAVSLVALSPAALGSATGSLAERAEAWTTTTFSLGADADAWLSRPVLAVVTAAVALAALAWGRREAA